MSSVRVGGLPSGKTVALTLDEARLLHEYMALNPVKSRLEPMLVGAEESDPAIRLRSGDYLYVLNAVNAIRAEGEPLGDGLRELGALLLKHHA